MQKQGFISKLAGVVSQTSDKKLVCFIESLKKIFKYNDYFTIFIDIFIISDRLIVSKEFKGFFYVFADDIK